MTPPHPALSAADFPAVFAAIHRHAPFPWQVRLLGDLVAGRGWRPIDLPTGSGKTAVLDVALFHLALEAHKKTERTAPVRIAFVVDRRLIVDAAHERAKTIAAALLEADPAGSQPLDRMAAALLLLAGDGPPLVAQALRGGLPREADWARTPAQPTILCSTVDQVGSRLLFRGYGVSDSMKPVHAGLLGSDCLLLLDEAHLSEPFRQTLAWIDRYRRAPWTERPSAPWQVVPLTATRRAAEDSVASEAPPPFRLEDADRRDPILSRRLAAGKPVALRLSETVAGSATTVAAFAEAALDLLRSPHRPRTLAVVVNRVAIARACQEALRKALPEEEAEVILLTGRTRGHDRDQLMRDHIDRLRSNGTDNPAKPPLIVVATQTIEAGADFDFDAMVSQIAPLDALRQRFGRLNRMGRHATAPGIILATKGEVGARAVDVLYGDRLATTWKWLLGGGSLKTGITVDFGLDAMAARLDGLDTTALDSPATDAPVLRPADIRLFSQTAPVPAVDPEVSLFLHGPRSGPADVQVVWRADITPDDKDTATAVLALVPPHAGETLAMPVSAVRQWLRRGPDTADLSDVEGAPEPAADSREGREPPVRAVFRWAGPDSPRTGAILPSAIAPGDVIVVPADTGGCDRFGWAPDSAAPVADLGDDQPPHRRPVLRLHRKLQDEAAWRAMEPLLQPADDTDPADTMAALAALGVAVPANADLIRPAGYDGAVLVARRRSAQAKDRATFAAVTEDDTTGSLTGTGASLVDHHRQVAEMAQAFATAAGLPPDLGNAVTLAALLHDEGKRDERFQVFLHGGDRLAALAAEAPLAKSLRPMTRAQSLRARQMAALPPSWRHEAQSVFRVRDHADVATAVDPALVLWLIGTHHGHGRPLFPHADPLADARTADGVSGPQCLDFQAYGRDWAQMFDDLKCRYGPWDLARLEAVMRLADHRASEAAERESKA